MHYPWWYYPVYVLIANPIRSLVHWAYDGMPLHPHYVRIGVFWALVYLAGSTLFGSLRALYHDLTRPPLG